MRLWSFVLLECLALGGAGAGVIFGAHRLQRATRTPSTLSSTMLVPLDPARLDPAPIDVARDATGTFLGMDDDLLIDRMRHADIVQAKLNKGGTSISFRLDFAEGWRAAFKPEQINPQSVPRKEVAAYRINRWLGFNHVAPATMRTFHRDELVGKLPADALFTARRIDAETLFDAEGFTRGEMSYWIPVIVDSKLDTAENVLVWSRWMTIGEEIPPDKVDLMAQLSSLLVFDMLTNNSDRFSGGNLMSSKDGRILFWMDNTFGFQLEPEGHVRCRTALMHSQKFSRKMVAALRRLDMPALQQALAPEPDVLNEAEMTSVIARKDVTLRYVDGLIAQFGTDAVLVFP